MGDFFEEESAKIQKDDSTFFNPAQKLNRDISAAAIKAFFKNTESIRILTAMSATGLRGIRYLNEMPGARVFFNDISPSAILTIQNNLKLNGFNEFEYVEYKNIRQTASRVTVTQSDCSVLMNSIHGFFDVIDVDPFGSCSQFVNDALRAIRHNGLICFTCTDKAALCSNEDKCFVRYNTRIKRIFSKNETPVRVLLSYISREAAKFGASITPIISLSVDFYVRVIVSIKKSKEKAVLADNSYALICNCMNLKLVGLKDPINSICEYCGTNMRMYGPFWNKTVYSKEVIDRMISSTETEGNERLVGILRQMAHELEVPFYYKLTDLCSLLKVNSCKLKELMNAIRHAGFRVSRVYYDNNAVKTDAPLDVIKKMMIAKHSKENAEFDFSSHPDVEALFEIEMYRGKVMSGMKPGTLPKN